MADPTNARGASPPPSPGGRPSSRLASTHARARPASPPESAIVDSGELGRRIHRLRGELHLTLKQVQEVSGLSATHLSEIERGRTSPTIGALTRVARALGRDASYFIEAEELPDVAHLPRERLSGFTTPDGAQVTPLTPGVPGSCLFAYRLSLDAGAARSFSLLAQETPGEALYFVRHGRVESTIGEIHWTLAAGDAAQGRLSCDHALRAVEGEPAEVIVLLTRRIGEAG
jgi:transcriptional regulator with XRE-family HTH domain